MLNRLSNNQDNYGRKFKWGRDRSQNDGQDDGLTPEERAAQQEALFKAAGEQMKEQDALQYQQPYGSDLKDGQLQM